MVKIIVESGSTKADWVLTKRGLVITQFRTAGLNPLHHSAIMYEKLLSQKITAEKLLLGAEKVIFFGAGIKGDFEREKVKKCFLKLLDIKDCKVMSDMDAILAVNYSEEPRLLTILGTGTGTAVAKKGKIIKRHPSVGFLLDEYGCGTYIGKRIISAFIKGWLPTHIEDIIQKTTELGKKKMIRYIYESKPLSAQVEFFASIPRYIYECRHDKSICTIIESSFEDFIYEEIKKYGENWNRMPIHIYGSVAYYYQDILIPLLKKAGYEDIHITQSPLPQLLELER